jgi:hypothetical protein
LVSQNFESIYVTGESYCGVGGGDGDVGGGVDGGVLISLVVALRECSDSDHGDDGGGRAVLRRFRQMTR